MDPARRWQFLLLAALLTGVPEVRAAVITLFSTNAAWRFLAGRSEASSPDLTAWRAAAFNDTGWATRSGAFYYGETGFTGSRLDDMQGAYTSFFLRKSFVVSDPSAVANLYLNAVCDDGFVAWINGRPAAGLYAPTGEIRYNSVASANASEPVAYTVYLLRPPSEYLVAGTNLLAIQVFNVSSGSSDIVFDTELRAELKPSTPPTVASVTPQAGIVSSLTSITVTFTEDVTGVRASDLLLNGRSATSVAGDGATYTFRFEPPPIGPVQVSWDPQNQVRTLILPTRTLDVGGSGMNWTYELVSPEGPKLIGILPLPGITVRQLGEIEIQFDQAVQGIDAADLRLNGQAATNLTGLGAGPFRFQFAATPAGNVTLNWVPDHGIAADSVYAPAFTPSSWAYTLDPQSPIGSVVLNEIMADNTRGLTDLEGERPDWIELYNVGDGAVNLAGWSLTDDPAWPGQWVLPSVVLPAKGYLVVFASGKDRRVAAPGDRLHTNFKLSISGEYLGLFSPDGPRLAVSELSPRYPEQRADYAHGRTPSGTWALLATATPGGPNSTNVVTNVVEAVHFSQERCRFGRSCYLTLSCPTPGVTIRYTIDATTPSETNGLVYSAPILLRGGRIVRAAAFKPNYLPSAVSTHTFLFGAPTSPVALPALSLVVDRSDLFGPTGIMEYNPRNTTKHGLAWERPASLEFLAPDDEGSYQINCGIRVAGGGYIRERYQYDSGKLPESKYSFRLYFRGDYGPSELNHQLFLGTTMDHFDRIVLRAGMNDVTNPFLRDEMVRQLASDVGQVASHGMFAHLYLNGSYQGYYNPAEHIDEDFLRSYHGGTNAWDIIAPFGEVVAGDANTWNAFRTFVQTQNLATPSNYVELMRQLDLVNFIDYLLPQIYADNDDWPHNNWRVARERVAGGKFRFYVWDAEWAFGYGGHTPAQDTIANQLSSLSPPWGTTDIQRIFNSLKVLPEFKLLFADRVHRHLFNGGALTDGRVRARYEQLKAFLIGTILDFNDTIGQNWIPQRRPYLLSHLNQAGFLASSNAPVFSPFGGRVPAGYALTFSAPAGVIYYTTNGSDPRVMFSGAVAPGARAYAGPLRLEQTTVLKARTLNGSTWSALTEATFEIEQIAWPLRITEIMYAPPGGDAYEFIELWNASTVPLPLGDFTLVGVDYRFPANGPPLAPGARLVLASALNPAAFAARYPGVSVGGYFGGSLSNGGERVAVRNRDDQIVASVTYDDDPPWPVEADGSGASLELINADGDPDDPLNWRASTQPGGSPGAAHSVPPAPVVMLNEILALNESAPGPGGGFSDWIELWNPGPASVDLTGWSVSDNQDPRRFVFPPGTALAAGAYLVLWCDADTNAPGLQAGFGLDASGETVALYDSAGQRIDGVTFGSQVADRSLGRVGEPAQWRLTEPTPGAPNEPAVTGTSSSLAVNEMLANPVSGGDDWLELHNRDSLRPVPLHGLTITTTNGAYQYRAPGFVRPAGFAVLAADEQPGPKHLGIKLPAGGGRLELTDAAGAAVDRVDYSPQIEGVTSGRLPDGTGAWTNFPGSATPNASNFVAAWTGPVLNEFMARNANGPVDPTGRRSDWLEIYHPGSASFDLSGYSLSLGQPEVGRWTFPAGTAIAAGACRVLWASDAWPASTNASPTLNVGVTLAGEGGAIRLIDPMGRVVAAVTYGFQIDDLTCGRWDGAWQLLSVPTPGTTNAAPATLGEVGSVRFNEWLAASLDGADWFELFNPEPRPVSLAGRYLTDSASFVRQTKFTIGPLTFIPAGGFVSWVADGKPDAGPDHVDFNLDARGEMLRLNLEPTIPIDTVPLPAQFDNVSEGRLPDGATPIVRFPESPTPGRSNFLPLPDVVISEVLTHTDPPLEDAIELRNLGGVPVNLSGWYLSNADADLKRYLIPPDTILPAGGYCVFYERQFNPVPGQPPSFALNSAHGDEVHLSATGAHGQLTGYRAEARFGAAANGVAFGRHATSVGVEYPALSARTFGVDQPTSLAEFRQGTGLANAAPAIPPVVINEIMYHPTNTLNAPGWSEANEEFVELHNRSGGPLDLYDLSHPTNRWRLEGAVRFVFPEGSRLAAGESLLIVGFDPTARADLHTSFRQKYAVPADVRVLGPFEGSLNNAGERLELLRPDRPQAPPQPDAGYVPYLLTDHVDYRDATPWPAGADGLGLSLQRRSASLYGNEPLHWKAADPTPGRSNVAVEDVDRDGDGMPDVWETEHQLRLDDPADAALDSDGDGQSNLSEYLAGTDPRDATDRLALEFVVSGDTQQLHFTAQAGRSYTVQFSDEVGSGIWFKVIDVQPFATAHDIQITIAESPTGRSRVYRVVMPAQP